jgi:hypothetical protein
MVMKIMGCNVSSCKATHVSNTIGAEALRNVNGPYRPTKYRRMHSIHETKEEEARYQDGGGVENDAKQKDEPTEVLKNEDHTESRDDDGMTSLEDDAGEKEREARATGDLNPKQMVKSYTVNIRKAATIMRACAVNLCRLGLVLSEGVQEKIKLTESQLNTTQQEIMVNMKLTNSISQSIRCASDMAELARLMMGGNDINISSLEETIDVIKVMQKLIKDSDLC